MHIPYSEEEFAPTELPVEVFEFLVEDPKLLSIQELDQDAGDDVGYSS